MSAAIYPVRLYWAGSGGCARLDGREVKLGGPPQLPGLAVEAIDYAPGACAMVMPRREGWRDMTHDEILACRQLLAELTKE